MAETAKKAKKKKGKTIALTEFLAKEGENGPSPAAVFSARSTSWADESENLNTEVDTSWPEESYGGISTENRLRAARDRAALPTAPRAARGPDIDSTKIPDGPPFTAFLGNLSYDVDKDDILEFFGNKKITEVRLPQDSNGRPKGFGYAEFEDKESLIAALVLNNEHLKNRRIRVDVAGQQHQERERGDRDRRDEPDRTDGDWRSKAEPQPDQNGYNDRDRYYDDMGSRDRWGPRGYDSGPRDRSGHRGYDDGPRERSGYGRDRGFDDGPRGRDFGPPDRRGDDRFGDRDRGKGFGSGWDHGDRDRRDDRGYDGSDSGYGRSDNRRYGDRFGGDRDRGGGFGRDRAYDDRRAGDRFGGDRYGGDRFGGDRSGGDRFGGDRYGGERYGGDRYGDRGGGYGRDRHDDRRYEDRRYDDRRGGERFGDRDRRRDYDDRERERSSWRDSRDARSDFDRDEREPVKERPRLQLQPRTKPVEETKDEPVPGSSVFGGAKPVDTAAKEREIEEKLARQKLEDEARLKQEKEKQKERRERDEWPRGSSGRARRDSNRSSDGERGPKERRDSNRRDSARSSDEGLSGKESETPPRESPRGGDGKESKEVPKEVPKDAPPPAVNVWARRMEQQKAASTNAANADKTEPKSPTEERRVEINVDSSSMTVTSSTTPTSPDRKGFFGKPTGPKKDLRESRDGGGAPRGRGRGLRSDRGDRSERVNANDPERGGGRGVRKEKRERKPAEPKRYEENPQPVFHTASKFSALLADEDPTEQDTEEQFDEKSET